MNERWEGIISETRRLSMQRSKLRCMARGEVSIMVERMIANELTPLIVTADFWVSEKAEPMQRDTSGAIIEPGCFSASVVLGPTTDEAGNPMYLTHDEWLQLEAKATIEANS